MYGARTRCKPSCHSIWAYRPGYSEEGTATMAPVKRFHWLQRIVTLLLLLMGCHSLAHAEEAKRTDLYRLRAGDQVAITVTPQTAYACGGAVLPDGMLYLKNVGTVRAAGMTLLDLEDKVRTSLAEKLVAPKISATITQFA